MNKDNLRHHQKKAGLPSGGSFLDRRKDDDSRDKLTVDSQIEADIQFMTMALAEARAAGEAGEVPVGALLVIDGRVISRGRNSPITMKDPTAHAEIVVLRRAAELVDNYRLTGATLYVTLEPCLMCAGAILQARVGRLVFAAFDPKAGAVGSLYDVSSDSRLNHFFNVTSGVMEKQSAMLLKGFFQQRRAATNHATLNCGEIPKWP